MGSWRVVRTEDVADAMALAEGFLAARPVEHNLVLTILHQRRLRPLPGQYWSVLHQGAVVGFALRSPRDFLATVTPLPRSAVAPLVEAFVEDAPDLAGLNGEASTVAALAGQWAERTGVAVSPMEAHRLYCLDRDPVPRQSAGTLRRAGEAEQDLLVDWSRGFETEIGLPHPEDIAVVTRRRIDEGRLWVWDDGGPVSAAGATVAVAGVARVNFVYTPPERRRRGYAAACVSALSAHLRATEAEACVLYAQLANPISNGIYHRIGYRAVTETLVCRFGADQ